ncbi:MAG: hypothetical protein CMJ58_07875 [Planctomycetaceae bacterium]|nr:hypothetical protein [Planctomycetaceae bacterium]
MENTLRDQPERRARATRAVVLMAFATVCVVLPGGAAAAHETTRQRPSAAELAEVEPPLRGAEAFARRLLERFAGRYDGDQLELLDSLAAHLQQADQIRWGLIADATPAEGDYHRWRAEQDLLKLLATFPDIHELDYRPGAADPPPVSRLDLGAHDNVVILKVTTSDGPPRFCVQPLNLAAEHPSSGYPVNIGSEGASYVLLELNQIPEGTSVSTLGFIPAGREVASHWHNLAITTSPWGHLAIRASNEHGHATPVIMQIASREGGRLWEPAGAVNLRAQLNDVVPHLSQLGRGYTFFLPGANRGRYWVVPEELETPIPVGRWDVTVLHGPEYKPVRDEIDVQAGQWVRKNYQLERWIDMPARGWYSGDDHVHARLISSEDAENLLDYACAVDVHVANILEMGDCVRTYYAQRGYGREFRVQRGDHWLVPGQEDPRSVLGHAIGLNLDSKVRDLERYLLNDWLAAEIHRQGGLYGHTHVGANACVVHREMAIFTPLGIVDFNSIMQANLGTELFYDQLNLGFKMTASAGADTPYGGTIGAVRAYAYCGVNQKFTPDAWFEAMKLGRTFVTNGPMLELKAGDQLPGAEIPVRAGQTLHVTASAEGLVGSSAPEEMRLIWLGEPLVVQRAESADQAKIEMDVEVPVDFGGWLAVHAIGRDGSEAHSTPIYVVREGFRHWNHERAPQIIQKQLAAIDDAASALAESERLVAQGGNPLDAWNRLNARQADAVRERLRDARAAYAALADVARAEGKQRSAAAP